MRFSDRADAGRRLGSALQYLRNESVVVLGLPRGGVPVAREVARVLRAPLDVIVIRKLGVPFQPELAMGAIGEDGVCIINDDTLRLTGVSANELKRVEARERVELQRRARRFRGDRPQIPIEGRTVVLVDDGLATGSTARAACKVARARGAARVILAVPVAPQDWKARLGADADDFVCLEAPEMFFAVGQFYDNFAQTSDEEVLASLEQAAEEFALATGESKSGGGSLARDDEVEVAAGAVRLAGHLVVPQDATGVVVFVHGSGSSRHSPRNRHVASVLNEAGLATLLFDLLTVEEEDIRANVFDIPLLAHRLNDVTRWLRNEGGLAKLSVGYFGASTGAGAALWAAAEAGAGVAAVVSRGGRPDLASPRLGDVLAPTLLIVGSRDEVVLELNRQAQSQLCCENRLVVVPGATHLFEEPGTLTTVAEIARDWFIAHFADQLHPIG